MCGITGFWQLSSSAQSESALCAVAGRMADALRHRGPDDAGTWADKSAGVALGHRRLSIVDLSPAGHQPMVSVSGRYVVAFNGEIYNHQAIRGQLAVGCSQWAVGSGQLENWRGHSDTETLLAAFEQWGIEETLRRCVGMFAIALWDTQDKTLYLARDRFGEKPLYYGWVEKGADRAFVFGSELKALRAHPGFDNPVSREALAEYLRFMYVPAPLSIYEGIYKLEPGCLLRRALNNSVRTEPVEGQAKINQVLRQAQPERVGINIKRWWSLSDVVQRGRNDPITDEVGAVAELEVRLSEAVRLQSLADVPLGAFLSGGVDSSAIVALMQHQATRPVKTFTVGFDEAGFDESSHALAVARHLGTEHHELRLAAQMVREVIPELPHMYDEPFADSSQIPTHLVCKAARQHVTVALSGDAGDELFGGYNRYFWGPRIWNRLDWMPFRLRRVMGSVVRGVPVGGWDALSGAMGVNRLGDKAHKLAAKLSKVRDMDDLYWSLVTQWDDPAMLVRRVNHEASLRGGDADAVIHAMGETRSPRGGGPRDDEAGIQSRNDVGIPPGIDPVERMMFRDSLTYLPDDILCKVDRAAMACSLETRVPFLDYRVAELSWRLPLEMKIRGNTGKWVLRQLLYKYVPKELIERPKAGFSIPIGQWLRGPLRDWAEALLDEARLEREGYFYPAPIRKLWQEHLSGRHDWSSKLWSVLMFQAWLSE